MKEKGDDLQREDDLGLGGNLSVQYVQYRESKVFAKYAFGSTFTRFREEIFRDLWFVQETSSIRRRKVAHLVSVSWIGDRFLQT